jgi:O-acetyl-ADP-ribose deacetylase (regulator of RNase III)
LDDPVRCFIVLKQLYVNIFEAIKKLAVRTIAIPPIGTRSYGFPMHEAAEIAVNEVKRFVCATGCCVEFSVVEEREYCMYRDLLRADLAFKQCTSTPPVG